MRRHSSLSFWRCLGGIAFAAAGPLIGLQAGTASGAPLFRPVNAQSQQTARTISAATSDTMAVAGEPEPFLVASDAGALKALAGQTGETIVEGVPLADGRTASFLVKPYEVFTKDARILQTDGVTVRPLPRPAVAFFRGTSPKDSSLSLFLAVPQDGEGRAVGLAMERGKGATLISPVEASDSTSEVQHLVTSRVPDEPPFLCGADDLPGTADAIAQMQAADTSGAGEAIVQGASTLRGVEVAIDIGYDLYTNRFASDATAATSYATNLIAACSAVYQRDLSVQLQIPALTVWTAREPFITRSGSTERLYDYTDWNKANRTAVSRDLFHMLDYSSSGASGVAWIRGLCSRNYGYGYSKISGRTTFPATSFSADVFVVTHELGHNFGSPHTHCYSPPIDKCYNGESSCYTGAAVPELGTIMSYCHLTNGQGKVDMTFHPRTITEAIAPHVQSSPCLSEVPVTVSAFAID